MNVCDCNFKMPFLFQTNDVNQGDALEHDFSALYLALTFPVKHLLDANLPQVCTELPWYMTTNYHVLLGPCFFCLFSRHLGSRDQLCCSTMHVTVLNVFCCKISGISIKETSLPCVYDQVNILKIVQ